MHAITAPIATPPTRQPRMPCTHRTALDRMPLGFAEWITRVLARGRLPTVESISVHWGVSRATAYRYLAAWRDATPDQLRELASRAALLAQTYHQAADAVERSYDAEEHPCG